MLTNDRQKSLIRMKQARKRQAKLERKLDAERASQANSEMWIAQNNILRTQLLRLRRQAKVVAAKIADVRASHVHARACVFSPPFSRVCVRRGCGW